MTVPSQQDQVQPRGAGLCQVQEQVGARVTEPAQITALLQLWISPRLVPEEATLVVLKLKHLQISNATFAADSAIFSGTAQIEKRNLLKK